MTMTTLGKALVFVNLAISGLLLAWAVNFYTHRIDWTDTRYSHLTFKHVLMPVWTSAYRYRDKTYRFIVNGQTGETSGESLPSIIEGYWMGLSKRSIQVP